jgi:hypothetical protein
MVNYLKVSRKERGLLMNFGADSLQLRRVVCSKGFRRPKVWDEVDTDGEGGAHVR